MVDREVVPQHVADLLQADPLAELASLEQVAAQRIVMPVIDKEVMLGFKERLMSGEYVKQLIRWTHLLNRPCRMSSSAYLQTSTDCPSDLSTLRNAVSVRRGHHGLSPGEAGFDWSHCPLVWAFWRDMRSCSNGVPVHLQHQVWTPDKDDPRGLGGDQISMTLSSWNLLYDYLGDEEVKSNMTRIADYWLGHGMSKPTDLWANLPYPYNTDIHSGRYDGDMRAGKNFLQPDKAGSFGAELVTLYKITGNRKYLDAATGIADSLAAHIRPGDADNSPWPFRVNALTGEVHRATTKDDKPISASYTTNDRSSRLFNDLIALNLGNVSRYRKCVEITTAWIRQFSLRTNKWGPFFEDVKTADY